MTASYEYWKERALAYQHEALRWQRMYDQLLDLEIQRASLCINPPVIIPTTCPHCGKSTQIDIVNPLIPEVPEWDGVTDEIKKGSILKRLSSWLRLWKRIITSRIT